MMTEENAATLQLGFKGKENQYDQSFDTIFAHSHGSIGLCDHRNFDIKTCCKS